MHVYQFFSVFSYEQHQAELWEIFEPFILSFCKVWSDVLHVCCLVCIRDFAKTIKRPFSVYYNPYTQSIDLLKDTRSIENVVQDLRSDLTTVCDALGKMNTYMGI